MDEKSLNKKPNTSELFSHSIATTNADVMGATKDIHRDRGPKAGYNTYVDENVYTMRATHDMVHIYTYRNVYTSVQRFYREIINEPFVYQSASITMAGCHDRL